MLIKFCLVSDDARLSIGVYGGIIPGGYAQFDLIPRGGDIGVRSLEDYQHLALCLERVPLRIAQGHMRLECAVWPRLRLIHKRQWRRNGHAIILHTDQRGETIIA